MLSQERIYEFAKESNEIERVYDERRHLNHAAALEKLLRLDEVTVEDLENFVDSIEPGARLRTLPSDRVWIGGSEAPPADLVSDDLPEILADWDIVSPNRLHKQYENLHPFMDGNGRSGRAFWLWCMMKREGYDGRFKFLQMYYYLTLSDH